ncbi:hypothetical protein BBO_07992 [Beauveria brongniartii RCEF 3172]|uniref:Uncharacterized protein n=1 Tax=Beauveria brongniartii RCEF 3172 TaxID=1081107 RepID=A0A166YB36_9HYPO|nr:hypothetical protein BBO_07992 [Beauveria brongniartii RCEF 3172]
MGFLTFLQRRPNDKTSFSNSSSTINLQRSNTPTAAATLGSQSDADLQSHQHAHRQQHGSQVQYESCSATPTWATSLSHSNAESQQQRRQSEPRISAYPNNESLALSGSGRRQSAITYSDLALRRSSLPLESCAAAASRYVDILDAQGQLGSSDFKARLQASGSRDYGEDVAERNIGQNGLLLGSPAVQQFYAAQSSSSSSQTSPRRPTTSRYRRYAQKQVILEQPEMEAAFRPSSRASSVYTARSLPIARTRVTPIYDSPIYTEPRRASLASHYTASSMGLPKLQEGCIREEMDSGESDDAAFPPSIPRFRRSEADSNAAQQQHRPASALGWVSRARQSVEVLSAYDMGEPIWKESVDHMFQDDGASRRPATRNQKSGPAAQQQQNLSVENMIRWRRTFGEVDDEDQRSVAATERATESRASHRQWSIASTEPTERSDVSSVYCPRPASRATANTSVDLRSLMELDDSGCCCNKAASHDDVVVVDDDVDACSITTDGSNIDAFVEKRKQRAAPEDQALLFNEGGFFNTGGALPGLFDPTSSSSSSSSSDGVTPLAETPAVGQQQVLTAASAASSDSKRDSSLTLRAADAPTTTTTTTSHKTARSVSPAASGCGGSETTESAPEDGRHCCSSVVATTPEPVGGGLTVPQIYLNQRQRLLALGFDYDTDEDGDKLDDLGDDDDDAKTLRQARHGSAMNLPRLSIIVEAPPKDAFDSYSSSSSGDDSTAAATLRRRKEAKRLSRCGGPRVMRVHRSLRDEFDGNVADVE